MLAHATCNGKKSDRLAAEEHLDRLAFRQRTLGEQMTAEFTRHGIVSDAKSSARIANWAYSNTFQSHGLTWVRGDELCELDANWGRLIAPLLN